VVPGEIAGGERSQPQPARLDRERQIHAQRRAAASEAKEPGRRRADVPTPTQIRSSRAGAGTLPSPVHDRREHPMRLITILIIIVVVLLVLGIVGRGRF
jgi:hypothetical protein